MWSPSGTAVCCRSHFQRLLFCIGADQHNRAAGGHQLGVQQQPHWQQQHPSPLSSHPQPPVRPLTPQLHRPAHYPDPESGMSGLHISPPLPCDNTTSVVDTSRLGPRSHQNVQTQQGQAFETAHNALSRLSTPVSQQVRQAITDTWLCTCSTLFRAVWGQYGHTCIWTFAAQA